ncbi:hypothetical protein F3Y22_tig00110321pilonHSYRG00342 [Hibiscus syriacus]|uniref:FAR1 domain-containing protein n=1 Tax=Hibiscus syriacus TaxID=106335 RepID=A0A6A3B5C3_HIBSY|nr:hypothetical protein F3Y22_tig00110321pilonHSYRG00342 [Hibiscus syriacus]
MDHTDTDNVKPIEEFHEGFAREHGFSARQGTTRLDMEGNVKTQEFCCLKEGFRVSKVNTVDRQRAHTPFTRTRCKARVVVTVTNTNDQWVINKSYQKHNHTLCTPAMTPFMRSNRAVRGYHNVGFTHKDLYNALRRGKAKEIVNGDVNALIAYFDYKKHDDPGFFVTYSVDESGALHNLIWSDSTSRSDYICFSDVIAFDTTYKDNLYGRSIMPIVDVNHHHNTIVFATAIIVDETSQSFEAMQRAIKSVIPNAKHKLCSWHLSRNAQANIGNPKFTAAFSKCMASWWITNEFDIQWHSIISEFNVEKHYGYESMDASLTIALKHKKTYLDVVCAIEDEISRIRLNELKADYLSS